MCGIIGYLGEDQAFPIIIECLKKMEYRGYDSWGIAISDYSNITYNKDIGTVKCIDRIIGNLGIGHVRWATHGKVDVLNAHPHYGCTNELMVVHNGIIENYDLIKRELEQSGHKFITDTDTEVIAHFLDNKEDLLYAINSINKIIVGSYAYLVMVKDKIFGTRYGSNPLFVGEYNNNYYIASDYSIFPNGITIYNLNDGDVVVIDKNSLLFYDSCGNIKDCEPLNVNRVNINMHHDENRFYMIEEIEQQPKVLLETLCQNENNINDISKLIKESNQIVITACGSSRYAALVGRYLLSSVGKKFCDVVMASEFKYFDDSLSSNTVIIAVSQSGETVDVIDGVLRAKQKGATIISIINRHNSILGNVSDKVIYLNCGDEVSVAATKSFICQLGVFYMISHQMVGELDKCRVNLVNVANLIYKEIASNELENLVKILNSKNDLYYIARGINFAIASEGALKLKEVSYLHAEGLPAGELKHGTLSLVENGTPVIVICPDDYTYNDTLNNAIEAKTRGAFIVGVSDRYNKIYDYWVKIGKVEELYYPIVETIPLQLIAYYLAVIRGCNPDRPRNLAKSVTVK